MSLQHYMASYPLTQSQLLCCCFLSSAHSLSHSGWNDQLIEHTYPLILSQNDRKCVIWLGFLHSLLRGAASAKVSMELELWWRTRPEGGRGF